MSKVSVLQSETDDKKNAVAGLTIIFNIVSSNDNIFRKFSCTCVFGEAKCTKDWKRFAFAFHSNWQYLKSFRYDCSEQLGPGSLANFSGNGVRFWNLHFMWCVWLFTQFNHPVILPLYTILCDTFSGNTVWHHRTLWTLDHSQSTQWTPAIRLFRTPELGCTPLSCGMIGCWQINSILANIGRKNSNRILNQYPLWNILI